MTPWPQIPLGELGANVRNACVGGPFGSELTTRDYVDTPGVPVIRGSNLGESGFVDDGFVYVSEEKARALQQNQARPGDVTFTQRGTIGQVAIIPATARYERYVLSQSQMKLTPDLTRVDPRFLLHYFRSPTALSFLRHNTLATGVPHINLTILRRVPVPLPPLPEQRRIADILDKADAIRRKRKEAIALTEELLRSAFLEMFGDPVTNPKGWDVRPLSELLSFLTSGSRGWAEYYSDAGDTFLRIQNVRHDRLDLSDVAFVRAPDSAEARRTLTVAGDVLLSITADLGRTAVVPEGMGRAFINQHLAILRPEGVHPEYLSSFLASDGGQRQFRRLNKGGVKAGLNFNDIRSVQVPLPSRSLQTTFAEFKRRVRRMESTNNRGLEEADRLFDSLVHLAFRGELGEGNRRSRPLRLLEEAGL